MTRKRLPLGPCSKVGGWRVQVSGSDEGSDARLVDSCEGPEGGFIPNESTVVTEPDLFWVQGLVLTPKSQPDSFWF